MNNHMNDFRKKNDIGESKQMFRLMYCYDD